MLNIKSYEDIGTKNIQEDKLLIFEYNKIYCYNIFDGHGTNSNDNVFDIILKNNILKKLFISFFTSNILNIDNIKLFFKKLDNYLLKKNINSGTCVGGIIFDSKNNDLYIYNIGDTIIQIYDQNSKLIFKTPIHDLNNKYELDRIIKYNKGKYIKNNRYKKLSMTRTLGDKDCKDVINEPLISIPYVKKIKNNKKYYFLMATDGINMSYNIDTIINKYINNEDISIYFNNILEYNKKKYIMVDNILFIIFTNNVIEKSNKFLLNILHKLYS